MNSYTRVHKGINPENGPDHPDHGKYALQSSGAGGQHAASVGVSTIHETPSQWGARINRARVRDGLVALTGGELAIYEQHVAHGRTLQAAMIEQTVMERAFNSLPF